MSFSKQLLMMRSDNIPKKALNRLRGTELLDLSDGSKLTISDLDRKKVARFSDEISRLTSDKARFLAGELVKAQESILKLKKEFNDNMDSPEFIGDLAKISDDVDVSLKLVMVSLEPAPALGSSEKKEVYTEGMIETKSSPVLTPSPAPKKSVIIGERPSFTYFPSALSSESKNTGAVSSYSVKQKNDRARLLAIGCSLEAVDQVVEADVIQNVDVLCIALSKFPANHRATIAAWKLFCMSGEVAAIKCVDETRILGTDIGCIILEHVAFSGVVEAMEYVVREYKIPVGSIPRDQGTRILMQSALSGSVKCVDYAVNVLKIDNIVETPKAGNNLLHIAAFADSAALMRHIIQEMAMPYDAMALNFNGFNALHVAIEASGFDAVRCAVEDLKIPVNEKTFDDRNALHLAAEKGSLTIIQYLLKKGAVFATTADDLDVYDYARKAPNAKDVIKVLKEFERNSEPAKSKVVEDAIDSLRQNKIPLNATLDATIPLANLGKITLKDCLKSPVDAEVVVLKLTDIQDRIDDIQEKLDALKAGECREGLRMRLNILKHITETSLKAATEALNAPVKKEEKEDKQASYSQSLSSYQTTTMPKPVSSSASFVRLSSIPESDVETKSNKNPALFEEPVMSRGIFELPPAKIVSQLEGAEFQVRPGFVLQLYTLDVMSFESEIKTVFQADSMLNRLEGAKNKIILQAEKFLLSGEYKGDVERRMEKLSACVHKAYDLVELVKKNIINKNKHEDDHVRKALFGERRGF